MGRLVDDSLARIDQNMLACRGLEGMLLTGQNLAMEGFDLWLGRFGGKVEGCLRDAMLDCRGEGSVLLLVLVSGTFSHFVRHPGGIEVEQNCLL